MKVRLLTARVGDGFSQLPGEIVDMPRDEALRYLQANMAETVEPNAGAETRVTSPRPAPESATVAPPEAAVKKTPKPRTARTPRGDKKPHGPHNKERS